MSRDRFLDPALKAHPEAIVLRDQTDLRREYTAILARVQSTIDALVDRRKKLENKPQILELVENDLEQAKKIEKTISNLFRLVMQFSLFWTDGCQF